MTTINGIEDLARILRENPDWADTIRSILLSQELLELPGHFAEFVRLTQESNRLTNERLERLENDVGELKSGLTQVNETIYARTEALDRKIDDTANQLNSKIDETANRLDRKIEDTANQLANQLNSKIDDTANRLDRKIDDTANQLNAKIDDTANQLNRKIEDTANQLNGRMDNGFGANYEYKVEKNIRTFAAQQLQFRSARVLYGARTGLTPELQELVNQAEGRGTITLEQVGELWAVDLMFNGRRQNDGLEVYVAAEASITIGDRDITRASERAGILAAATGSLAIPAVIGARIDEQRTALAAANNVTVILMPEDY